MTETLQHGRLARIVEQWRSGGDRLRLARGSRSPGRQPPEGQRRWRVGSAPSSHSPRACTRATTLPPVNARKARRSSGLRGPSSVLLSLYGHRHRRASGWPKSIGQAKVQGCRSPARTSHRCSLARSDWITGSPAVGVAGRSARGYARGPPPLGLVAFPRSSHLKWLRRPVSTIPRPHTCPARTWRSSGPLAGRAQGAGSLRIAS